jgi:hypothetical protein
VTKADDTNTVIEQVAKQGIEVMIPSNPSKKMEGENAASFLATVQIRCIAIWTEIS